MSDIFLSYISSDREGVRPIVQQFEQQGWTVWHLCQTHGTFKLLFNALLR